MRAIVFALVVAVPYAVEGQGGVSVETLEKKSTPIGSASFSGKTLTRSYKVADVEVNTQVHFKISLRNDSKTTLGLTQSKTSCGCLAAIPVSETIAPGDKQDIFLIFGSKDLGPFAKTITIRFGEHADETITLEVKGKVKSRFYAEPETIDLAKAQGQAASFSLRSGFSDFSKVTSVSSESRQLVNVALSDVTKKGAAVHFHVDESLRQGKAKTIVNSFRYVRLFVNDDGEQYATVVKIIDSSRLKVLPKTAIGRAGSGQGKMTFTTSLMGAEATVDKLFDNKQFHIVTMGDDEEQLIEADTKLSRVNPRAARIDITVSAGELKKLRSLVEVTLKSQDAQSVGKLTLLVPNQ